MDDLSKYYAGVEAGNEGQEATVRHVVFPGEHCTCAVSNVWSLLRFTAGESESSSDENRAYLFERDRGALSAHTRRMSRLNIQGEVLRRASLTRPDASSVHSKQKYCKCTKSSGRNIANRYHERGGE